MAQAHLSRPTGMNLIASVSLVLGLKARILGLKQAQRRKPWVLMKKTLCPRAHAVQPPSAATTCTGMFVALP